MNELLLVLVILALVALLAIWTMPDALHAVAGKLLEREAYILAGREAKAAQARSWEISQEWVRHQSERRRERFSVR